MNRTTALVAVLAVPLLLAGCTSGSSSTGGPASTSTPTHPVTTPSAPAATGTPSSDPDAPAGQCADDVLTVSVTPGDPGAGSVHAQIVFTNTGPTACVLRGAPGVSVVGRGDGTQLGEAADRAADQNPPAVTLAAGGGTASAPLQSVNIGTDGGPLGTACAVEAGDGYRVYPPHSYVAVFVPATVDACTSGTAWMTVGPVSAP